LVRWAVLCGCLKKWRASLQGSSEKG